MEQVMTRQGGGYATHLSGKKAKSEALKKKMEKKSDCQRCGREGSGKMCKSCTRKENE